jgi:hypothetical protein
VVCAPLEASACRSAPITLPAGTHSLVVRLQGGLRPAARVAVEPAHCTPGSSCARASLQRTTDYLAARSDQPVTVTLFGPAVLEAELRAPATPSPRPVRIVVQPSHGPAMVQSVSLPAEPAGHADRPVLFAGPRDISVIQTVVLARHETYRLEVRPQHGEVLCRLLVRDGLGTDVPPAPPPPATLRATGPAPLLVAPGLEEALVAHVHDGDVAPGWDDAGALAAELGWRKAVEVADADEVLPGSAIFAAVLYRRLVDSLHLTLKLGAEVRRWQAGSPSEAGVAHAYFQHPEARWARVFAGVEGATQPIGPGRASALDGFVMLEPIATLMSGVHFVSKLGLRLHHQSVIDLADDVLVQVDPEVFSRYAGRHPRALFCEEGFELAPLADLLFYTGARVTSTPGFSLRHPDHVSSMVAVRAELGRFTIDGGYRASWFPGTAEREAVLARTASLALMHTFWLGHTQAVVLGAEVDHHVDQHSLSVGVRVGWELSNGRRLVDHTAVEGENYFYPQRGPGRETGHLRVEEE